jgi:hypothetical protein
MKPHLQKLVKIMKINGGESKLEHLGLIPSFYVFIQYLVQQNRSFQIIFRTFGGDLPEVNLQNSSSFKHSSFQIIEEFNSFCEGKHKMFPELLLNGTNGLDLRVTF